jgi:parvulin-like peptidyl-prolyl isomerase
MKIAGMALLLIGLSSLAFAAAEVSVPEISPASGMGAVTLLSGALLVIRARRKR